jgi:hypothetical protein
MPCDSIQTSSIQFKAENTPLLVQALSSLGPYKATYRGGRLVSAVLNGVQISFEDGRIIVPRGTEPLIDQIKQAYSRQIVMAAANRFGFQLKQTGKNRFIALRRK